ncbi:NAD(P)H-dependent oxidoreductase [Mucilaginibacter segetis]|uniref:NAD(P)H-dependent oxidoreductase n=1 Tax=Mucilaginibacter segetis TaxID=2793071 RepID=A0A934PSG5_9SPHI|nr:NAD(P)H-dependent oxidoreductase [Mucilaginibacter segetis]MBK0379968.1 NAD(P)H-dependent oxidoreductase [Mucilaginibacter segetis]
MSIIDSLEWRYATKKFDPDKKISPDKLADLLKAVQLSPSSAGLQHYKVVVVEDAAIRERLRLAGYNQPQITDASQLIVFAAETNLDAAYARNYIKNIAVTRGVSVESLAGFEQMILGAINSKTQDQKIIWAQKQAYIGVGVLISVASEMEIDTCPMEGFEPEKFDEILGLKEKNLTSTVIVAIGFRAEDDPYSKLLKVRKPYKELFIHI